MISITGVVFMLFTLFKETFSSAGDRSYVYQRCFSDCLMAVCSSISDKDYHDYQPIPRRWFKWSCPDDCKYECMWKTVDAYIKDGTPVQQFHGKWPFVKVLGIQEPASVVFSLLNGVAHLIMLYRLRKQVSSKAPMYYMWHVYALTAVNAWFWAVVFHTRDFPFTERMDYFCATSLVLMSLFMLAVRLIGPRYWFLWTPVGACIVAFFVYHINYLSSVSFDYGYNMKTNVTVGILSAVGWVLWSLKVRQKQPYVWKAIGTFIALNVLVLLELGDFPPLWWTFDAHSLWHLGTAPVPFLWYSFVIDDCKYMLKETTEKAKKE